MVSTPERAVKNPRAFVLWMLVLVCCGLWSSSVSAQTSVIVGVGAFGEGSNVEGNERIAVRDTERNFDYSSDSFLNGSLRFLRPLSKSFYWGGGATYYGTYRGKIDEGEDTPDPPNLYEFGPLLELGAILEWRVGVTEKIDLALGVQGGLALVFPGGDLEKEIKRLKDQNVGVWDVPRPGYYLAPQVGARWKLDDRLAIRGDLLFKWERLHLFGIDEVVDGLEYERNAVAKVLRTEFVVSLEIGF